jgi:diketogulonate reductase-like aldo/keto reductase
MTTRVFGPTGAAVPIIGQGTWNLELGEREPAIEALRRGLDLGLTHIDTAEMYGLGAVETMVGEAIAGRRDQVFLVSKVLPRNASERGVAKACERSLRRLGTDRVDCYLLHYLSDEHPLDESLAALERLVTDGKARSWGVSNFDVDELERAIQLVGPGRIACNQVCHHLGERYVEGALYEACRRHGIALVGYSPFGSGRFPSLRTSGGRVLADIATAHGATPRQVALAFLTRLDGVFTIPKASAPAHVEENARPVQLSAADIARIDTAFPVRGASLPYL